MAADQIEITMPEAMLTTQVIFPSGVIAIAPGARPAMMSLTGLLVTVRSTVTYARARYSPHRLRHSAIAFILGASLRGVQDYDGCNDPCATRPGRGRA